MSEHQFNFFDPPKRPAPPVLDLAEGERLKREGMAKAAPEPDENVEREEHLALARRILSDVAHRQPQVVSDDLYAAGLPERFHQAMGSVWLWGARERLIAPANEPSRKSCRPARHASAMKVWDSLVYRGRP